MKILIDVAKLNDIIDISSRFVAKNSTLPILQNIYMKASMDNTLVVRATDMEKYVEIEVPCQTTVEWAITVNAKTFSDIIKTIDNGMIELTVDQQKQIVYIKSWKDSFDVNWIAASEYVALPDVPQDNMITLDTQALSQWIEKVEYSVTEKNFSPVMTWILIKTKEEEWQKKLVFVWTDSFRLTEYKANATVMWSDFALIIPKISALDIKKIADYSLEKEVDTVQVKYSKNLIAFNFAINDMKILATSLLVQWNFPDYEREEVKPTHFNTTLEMDKNECDKAIKKIWIFTRDLNNFIQIEINDWVAKISSGNTDKWAWVTEIPVLFEWAPLSFGINGKYITDFIRTMDSENIVFNIVDSQRPLVLQNKNDTNYSCVIRPLVS